jgi:hypothetical protein
MEEKVMYFNLEPIGGRQEIPSRPHEDFGFDWDKHSDWKILDNDFWTDSGLVKIDRLIELLEELKAKGANYVACDWHCDHQELEVVGAKFTPATEEQLAALARKKAEREEWLKEVEIKKLEERLAKLKNA